MHTRSPWFRNHIVHVLHTRSRHMSLLLVLCHTNWGFLLISWFVRTGLWWMVLYIFHVSWTILSMDHVWSRWWSHVRPSHLNLRHDEVDPGLPTHDHFESPCENTSLRGVHTRSPWCRNPIVHMLRTRSRHMSLLPVICHTNWGFLSITWFDERGLRWTVNFTFSMCHGQYWASYFIQINK
jgi:hypothetical protein